MQKSSKLFLTILIASFIVAGCTQQQQQQAEEEPTPSTNFTNAVAVVHPTEGNSVSGTVHLEQTAEGVQVTAELTGLSEGRHGFHIHQYGDCTASDGTSAGGHYNPAGNDHGAPTQDNRHVGDMGNIVADSEGNATINYTDPVIELNGPSSIIGRGIVVHGGEDDLESQPSGAAGPRVGCGVIGVANTSQ
ncbi:superoxide dismutase family protein [Aliifodinibius sp. S!AR15-10]|uniref:superoxide dismutase family protein n=1 Tax=Aliifodinibius sp. S!AR15-10 TaxID=2950437 RepID=UPI002858B2A2|nr:superoxide dismutase family protein [Aliifodinibius sp. S!AR15-10]MDR8392206.1 superoxide dismutase family protein [Aliifodinibius sp. S!AR15-10]